MQGDVEPIATLILYIHRFFNSVTTLAEHRRELSGEYQCPDFKQFADAIVQVLENISHSVRFDPQELKVIAKAPPSCPYQAGDLEPIRKISDAVN